MGSASSSLTKDGCYILDERSTFILVRNYVVILKMISYIEKILSGDTQLFNSVKTNFVSYLVDSDTMMKFIKELPLDVSVTFAKTEKIVIGVNDGQETTKEISFYDTYNDFFIIELSKFNTFDESKNRIKEILNNLKKKGEIVESIITKSCIKELGIY